MSEKIQALVHQTWLDYGGTVEKVREANTRVRQVLTDMGTEAAIADAHDVVAECLDQGHEARALSWLYPLALHIGGPQHILDGVLKDGVSGISWWKSWEASAKSMCQWLNLRGHREALQNLLRRRRNLPPEDVIAWIKALAHGVERFADWRWSTLGSVLRDLERLRPALRAVAPFIASADAISSKDARSARLFLEAVRSDDFWSRCQHLSTLSRPTRRFAGWIKACPCHEAECLAKRRFVCAWKGCRAPQLADRVQVALEDLEAARHEAHE